MPENNIKDVMLMGRVMLPNCQSLTHPGVVSEALHS